MMPQMVPECVFYYVNPIDLRKIEDIGETRNRPSTLQNKFESNRHER